MFFAGGRPGWPLPDDRVPEAMFRTIRTDSAGAQRACTRMNRVCAHQPRSARERPCHTFGGDQHYPCLRVEFEMLAQYATSLIGHEDA